MLVGAVGAGVAAAAAVARYQARRAVAGAGVNGTALPRNVDEVDDLEIAADLGAAEPIAPAPPVSAAPLSSDSPSPGPPASGPPTGTGDPPVDLATWSVAAGMAARPSEAPPAPAPTARVAFADVPPAARPPERTADSADANRPPLPSRTPQAQAPIPAEEPVAYAPPVFAMDDIAPLADLARASWGAPVVPDDAADAPADPPADSPAAPVRDPQAALDAPSVSASPAPAGAPVLRGRGPAGGPPEWRKWAIAGAAAVGAVAVVAGVAVAAGGDDGGTQAGTTTSTTDAPQTTTTAAPVPTAPASPEEAFRQASARLVDAGSFTYSGTARALDVTPVRPSTWLGTQVTVAGEVDLASGRLHEVAFTDGKATETVIDRGTVWGRTADTVEGLASAEYAVIEELSHEEATPQGAELLPVWLNLAAGPAPATDTAGRPAFSGTLAAASLGDDSGATPDAVVTVTLDDTGAPIHVEVAGVPDSARLQLVYDIADIGTTPVPSSPADAGEPAGTALGTSETTSATEPLTTAEATGTTVPAAPGTTATSGTTATTGTTVGGGFTQGNDHRPRR